MTESEIYLTALIKGDNKIISEIYLKFYPKIKTFIFNNKGRESDAQDVFHDALMYLIIKHKEKPLIINSFEGYLFTICKNIWRSTLKNKRVINNDVISLIEKESDLSLKILEQERHEFYLDIFQLLSSNCKEILGNYFNGMSYQEIVTELSYNSINTVRQRVFKCKSKLISLIKKDDRYNTLK